MSRTRRRAANTDKNQPEIVKALRKIPGISVEVDHDDILVGFRRRTYWFEIKSERSVSKSTGQVMEARKQKKQKDLEKTWTGHYRVVSNLNEILRDLGIGG